MSTKEVTFADTLSQYRDIIFYSFGGGRPVLPLRYVINLFKGFTFIWILSLMHFTGNKSAGMYLYLFLHGTYGLCWLTKDIIYPDATFKRSASVGSLIVLTLFLTGYWAIPIPLALGYGRNNPSLFRIISLVVLYVSGVILMMCSDYQKTIQLQKKKGLISNGFFSLTRNPNYLGEIMIYSSFALCADHLFGYLYVWIIASTLFATNVYLKDKLSYSKKQGWEQYQKQSYILLPKLLSSDTLNFALYGTLFIASVYAAKF